MANGLEMKNILSRFEPISSVSNIKSLVKEKFTKEAYVVIYLDYKVLIGKFKDGDFIFYQGESFEDRFVQRARIFDEKKELHIWRTAEGLKARLRIDYEGEDTYVVDAKQVLFGTKAESLGGSYTKLTEDRGTELIVPFEKLTIDDNKKRLLLHTRNYVGYNETFQAGYVDSRFVTIVNKED